MAPETLPITRRARRADPAPPGSAGPVGPSGAVRSARHHRLDHAFNLRDLGGYRGRAGQTVPWGRLFRADGLHRVSAADVARLQDLGLRTVVDLRTAGEVAATGHLGGEGSPFGWHHRPVLQTTWAERDLDVDVEPSRFLTDRYLEMLDEGRDAVAGLFALLALPASYPLVFHCSVGKDRTGVMAALILGVLGVRDDEIAGDYVLSASVIEQTIAWLDGVAPSKADELRALPAAHLATEPAAILEVLAAVRRDHGSVLGYLRAIGVPFETIEAVHANLLG